ncbi:hypothetical protein EOI86_09310 [Hwanghaeella grinnelliae]|uniref:DUF4410 domain-containing protein n=1 Tax=Hwanghaeella grinnelliae TaxID=2500179 RepID=A0A3S3USB7_9PROT|nr:hypothetical protein [Hwanghaeella grinnelliae]RVU39415.1 hypothetical protein EOI86_09310 [Hwanghaeella grinnelliae]
MTVKPLRAFLVVIGIAGLLSACDEATPRVVEMYVDNNGTMRYLPEAAQKGPILVQILPRAIASASGYESITLDLMNDAANQRTKNIFTANHGAAKSAVRVIHMMGAGSGVSGSSLCGGTVPEGVRGEKELKIVSVLCRGGQRLAEAHGWVRVETAAQDEEFRLVMIDLMNGLFKRPETER